MNVLLMNAVARVGAVASQVMPLATKDIMGNLVTWAGTIAGALIAVFLIYSIAKDAFGYIKGSGDASIFKIVTKVLFLIICIGLIVVAQNYENLMNIGAGVANSALDQVNGIADELIP